ncbi:MAG: ornithine cyclodeaminase [Ktedonobacterales bacterium]|nr:ornithine cyclodeaminase [Ktedonobacterales bacterium]
MLILTRDELRQAVPMEAAMEAVAAAFAQLSSGRATVPLRPHIPLSAADDLCLVMPAYLPETGALGVKVLTLVPSNPTQHGLPAIQALVLLFDAATGEPLALMDGAYLTALRTGAASGVATHLMARADAHVLALFGAGAQALAQTWAVCAARRITRVWIVNRTSAHAEQLAQELRTFGTPIPVDVRVAPTARAALAEADIVCCATGSPVPLFADADVRPGTHINGIGAHLPTRREVPGETVARARVIVDQRQAAWAEAGDLVLARADGLIDEGHVVAELGEIALDRIPGRRDETQVTFFKSVGNAAQDIAVAQLASTRARELGLGTHIAL